MTHTEKEYAEFRDALQKGYFKIDSGISEIANSIGIGIGKVSEMVKRYKESDTNA